MMVLKAEQCVSKGLLKFTNYYTIILCVFSQEDVKVNSVWYSQFAVW